MIKNLTMKHAVSIASIYLVLLASFLIMSFYPKETGITNNSLVVTATAAAPEGKTLVPKNVIIGDDDITQVELEYRVKIIGTSFDNDQLNVACTNIRIGDKEEYADIVNISVEKRLSKDKNEVIVTVAVSIDEPKNYQQYSAVQNHPITMDIVFTAYRYFDL